MKAPGMEGYKKDIDGLFYRITNIVDGVYPDIFFEGLNDGDSTKKKTLLFKGIHHFSQVFGSSKTVEEIHIEDSIYWAASSKRSVSSQENFIRYAYNVKVKAIFW